MEASSSVHAAPIKSVATRRLAVHAACGGGRYRAAQGVAAWDQPDDMATAVGTEQLHAGGVARHHPGRDGLGELSPLPVLRARGSLRLMGDGGVIARSDARSAAPALAPQILMLPVPVDPDAVARQYTFTRSDQDRAAGLAAPSRHGAGTNGGADRGSCRMVGGAARGSGNRLRRLRRGPQTMTDHALILAATLGSRPPSNVDLPLMIEAAAQSAWGADRGAPARWRARRIRPGN